MYLMLQLFQLLSMTANFCCQMDLQQEAKVEGVHQVFLKSVQLRSSQCDLILENATSETMMRLLFLTKFRTLL
jgi:hypothetical protein